MRQPLLLTFCVAATVSLSLSPRNPGSCGHAPERGRGCVSSGSCLCGGVRATSVRRLCSPCTILVRAAQVLWSQSGLVIAFLS
ncbi:hypothetical protein BDW66DRAFT_124638 [Aspergillus desertorum]